MSTRLSRTIAFCFSICLILNVAYAQDSWLGGTGDWTNDAQWSAGVPAIGSNVNIFSGGKDNVALDTSAAIQSLQLGGPSDPRSNPSELTDNGAWILAVAGTLNLGSSGFLNLTGGTSVKVDGDSVINGNIGVANGSSLFAQGNVFLAGGPLYGAGLAIGNKSSVQIGGDLRVIAAGFEVDNSSAQIKGNVFIGDFGGFTVENNAAVHIGGDLHATSGWEINEACCMMLANTSTSLTISGNLTNEYSAGIYDGAFLKAATIVNNGIFIQGYSNDFVGFPAPNVIQTKRFNNNGEFAQAGEEGTATLLTHLIVNEGTIEQFSGPGTSLIQAFELDNGGMLAQYNSIYGTGTILIGTDSERVIGYYQLASGTLGEIINTQSFGVVVLYNGGPVTLDGKLRVLLQSGYNLPVGAMYKFIEFAPGALSGEFSDLENDFFNNGNEKWVVIYDDADGYVALEATATPEPSTFLLLSSSLLLAFGIRAGGPPFRFHIGANSP